MRVKTCTVVLSCLLLSFFFTSPVFSQQKEKNRNNYTRKINTQGNTYNKDYAANKHTWMDDAVISQLMEENESLKNIVDSMKADILYIRTKPKSAITEDDFVLINQSHDIIQVCKEEYARNIELIKYRREVLKTRRSVGGGE